MKRIFIRIFAGLLLLFASGKLFAQNCNCPEFDALNAEPAPRGAEQKKIVSRLKSSSNPFCKAEIFNWLGSEFESGGQDDSAMVYYQQAENYYRQSACKGDPLIAILKSEATLYYKKGDFAKAQQASIKILNAADSSGNTCEQANAYTMIAHMLNNTGQATKGIIYTRKAVALLPQIPDSDKKTDLIFKISKRYLWHYQDTKTVASLDSSELFSYKVIALARATGNRVLISVAFGNLQGVAYERKDFKNAIRLLDSSFFYTDPEDYASLATNYSDRADLYMEAGDYKEAKRMADSCLVNHRKEGNVSHIAGAYALLSRVCQRSGDWENAFDYMSQSISITDSLRDVESTKEVTALERKYSQAKNEKTIRELNQEKEISDLNIKLLTAGIIGAVLIILLVFIFFRQNALKNRQLLFETEQRLNRARMNPHFFFNTLSALQTSALRDKDPLKIADLLSMYSRIMRMTLESTYEDLISIEQEIEYIRMYLSLQQFRTGNGFVFSIETAADIEPDEMHLPGMIIQPFIENAIEHGFGNLNREGKIDIRFTRREQMICITVTDNGTGIRGKQQTENHKSRATEITRDRLFLLNKKHKTNARFEIRNNEGNEGTTVEILLPEL